MRSLHERVDIRPDESKKETYLDWNISILAACTRYTGKF